MLVLVALVALPLALRGERAHAPVRLVIITPHGEPIRAEFARAFAEWARRERGVEVEVDWRTPGGTADIERYLDGQFRTAFRRAHPEHDRAVALAGITRAKPDAKLAPEDQEGQRAARAAFLASDASAGIDLMFGGGAFPFQQLADKGYLVDAGLLQAEPAWFTDAVIPRELSGETIYDAQGRWYGACLSVFGIAVSPDRLRDLGLAREPVQWADLAEPSFLGQLTLADPTRSGAVRTTLERILQQAMAATAAEDGEPDLARGWDDGLNRIKRMVGNARWITDSTSKPTRDTVRGDCAASMAIDFQARLEAEHARWESGRDGLRFHVPVGGTSVSADPIALLRGAPQRALAVDFIRFTLSPAGQRLWAYRVGTPGGPQRWALRRMPVRRDVLDDDWRRHSADPGLDPFALAATFTYRPAWTARHFRLVGEIVRAAMLDPRDELRAAWAAIAAAGGPERVPEAWRAFAWLPVTYAEADRAREALARPESAVPMLRAWSTTAMARYREARALAEAGR